MRPTPVRLQQAGEVALLLAWEMLLMHYLYSIVIYMVLYLHHLVALQCHPNGGGVTLLQ